MFKPAVRVILVNVVLFCVLAEIAGGKFRALGDQRMRRMRKQDLSAVTRVTDA